MKRQLVLSSHSVKNKNSNKPSDFTIKYTNPITLNPNKEYQIGLDRIISMSFTWFNITPELNNQKIRFSSDNGNWTDLNFTPGVWNYVDFNTVIILRSGQKQEQQIIQHIQSLLNLMIQYSEL